MNKKMIGQPLVGCVTTLYGLRHHHDLMVVTAAKRMALLTLILCLIPLNVFAFGSENQDTKIKQTGDSYTFTTGEQKKPIPPNSKIEVTETNISTLNPEDIPYVLPPQPPKPQKDIVGKEIRTTTTSSSDYPGLRELIHTNTRWSFGDGETANILSYKAPPTSTTHRFITPGIYQITAVESVLWQLFHYEYHTYIVKDTLGNTSTETVEIRKNDGVMTTTDNFFYIVRTTGNGVNEYVPQKPADSSIDTQVNITK